MDRKPKPKLSYQTQTNQNNNEEDESNSVRAKDELQELSKVYDHDIESSFILSKQPSRIAHNTNPLVGWEKHSTPKFAIHAMRTARKTNRSNNNILVTEGSAPNDSFYYPSFNSTFRVVAGNKTCKHETSVLRRPRNQAKTMIAKGSSVYPTDCESDRDHLFKHKQKGVFRSNKPQERTQSRVQNQQITQKSKKPTNNQIQQPILVNFKPLLIQEDNWVTTGTSIPKKTEQTRRGPTNQEVKPVDAQSSTVPNNASRTSRSPFKSNMFANVARGTRHTSHLRQIRVRTQADQSSSQLPRDRGLKTNMMKRTQTSNQQVSRKQETESTQTVRNNTESTASPRKQYRGYFQEICQLIRLQRVKHSNPSNYCM